MTLTITRPLQTARRRAARAAALTAAVLSAAAFFAANPATADADIYVTTYTCDVFHAGTDANVHVRLEGTKAISPWLYLNRPWWNDFERGNSDQFDFPNLPDLGTIKSIVIKRDTWGVADGWCLDDVRVGEKTPSSGYVVLGTYPWYNWVPAGSAGTRLYRN